ncbi:MAG: hypothetical protein R2941_15780 [Desulfobacterales bacterium]
MESFQHYAALDQAVNRQFFLPVIVCEFLCSVARDTAGSLYAAGQAS